MVEVIDKKTAQKMMAMVMCGICYQGDCYLVYCIKRDNKDVNVFVSKMFKGSLGYIIKSDFLNGEKEVLDAVVKRLLNRDNKEKLETDGFNIFNDFELDSNLSFDIEECYISTIPRSLIKDCLIFYGLVNEKMFEQPVVEVVDDKRMFNEGFASSIALIIFGSVILLISGLAIFNVLFG